VELSPTSVERALALPGEHDLEAAGDVEGRRLPDSWRAPGR